MQVGFLVFLAFIGASFGSFLCCQARRLHYREARHRPLGSRSVCLHCHHHLRWYDNVPVFSWLFLRGKCRYCHKKIGLAELLSELGLSLAFLLLGTTIDITTATPLEWATFVLAVLLMLILGFLAIYDGLYGELPSLCLTFALILAISLLSLREWSLLSVGPFSAQFIWQPLLSVLILGGIYLFLYLVSGGRWVGDGDWLLGTAIALALFDPWLALVALFLANFLAALTMYPSARKAKNHKIHLGPFLVAAFVITYSLATPLLSLLS